MRNYDKKYFFFAFMLACFVHEVVCTNKYNTFESDSLPAFNWTTNMDDDVEKFTSQWLDNSDLKVTFISSIVKDISFESISNQCKASLNMYFNDLVNLKPWALEMFDATGKPPSSFLIGTSLDFGSSDDCHRIKVHFDDESFLFNGQFCMIHLQHPLFQPSMLKTENGKSYVDAFGIPPEWIRDFVDGDISKRFGLYLGICTPSVCTEEDLHSIINAFAEPTASNVTITDCSTEQVNESTPWPLSAKLAAGVLLSILILCVAGTWLDLIDYQESKIEPHLDENRNRQLLKCFSVYTNAKIVFTNNTKKSPTDCTYGLRFVLCILVMVVHYALFPTLWNELQYKHLSNSHEYLTPVLLMVFLNNSFILVEGFFYLSSFLLVYIFWRKVEQAKGNIDIWENIIERYWRLTPTHMFLIIVSFILPLMSSGPVWNSSWNHENRNCLRNGWKNLFYIHNLSQNLDTCFIHTWYIGVTMQCVVIFIPLLVITYKYPKLGIFTCFVIWFGSMIHTFNTAIEEGFMFCSYNSFKIAQRVLDFSATIYFKTIFHLPSNLVGMLSGWMVLNYKDRKLSKVWLFIGWMFCVLCFTISLYGVHFPTTNPRVGALYIATRNTIYCLGLSWVVYACVSGNGGVVDKILSWRAFVPITRISYCLYIVHPLCLILRDASLTERLFLDKISHVVEVVPYLFISFILGFIVFVTVEQPSNRVYNLLKKKGAISNRKSSPSLHVPTSIDGVQKKNP